MLSVSLSSHITIETIAVLCDNSASSGAVCANILLSGFPQVPAMVRIPSVTVFFRLHSLPIVALYHTHIRCGTTDMSNTNCQSTSAFDALRFQCNGKTECAVPNLPEYLGGDPCRGTSKYLHATYKCVGKSSFADMWIE